MTLRLSAAGDATLDLSLRLAVETLPVFDHKIVS
jgi:hypothetical protein